MLAALWSSPFLQLRGLLKEFGYRDTGLNLAVDIGFALILTFARMIIGPYLTYVTLTTPNPLIIKLVTAFWFYRIVGMVGFKFCKWSSSTKNKSH